MRQNGERRLFLVRHGETVGQSSIRFHGSADVALADSGRQQVRRLIPRLADRDFVAVVSSPLSRAHESARILIEGLRRPPPLHETEADLREIHFGAIEGMTTAEIELAMPDWYRAWQADEVDAFPGDGDSIPGFWARVHAAFVRIVERHPSGDVLVVAHKGTLKAGIGGLCGLDRSTLRTWEMDLASLFVLRESRPWHVEARNIVG